MQELPSVAKFHGGPLPSQSVVLGGEVEEGEQSFPIRQAQLTENRPAATGLNFISSGLMTERHFSTPVSPSVLMVLPQAQRGQLKLDHGQCLRRHQ
jgi:hypothetical protein